MKNLIYIATVFVTGTVTVLSSLGSLSSVLVLMMTEQDPITLLLLAVGFAGCAVLGAWLLSGLTPEVFGVKRARKPRRKPRK